MCRTNKTNTGAAYGRVFATKEEYKMTKKQQRRSKKIQYLYGINLQQRNELLKRQKNKCLCCGSPMAFIKGTTTPQKQRAGVYASVDHCHYLEDRGVKYVRGILCGKCNSFLGVYKDSIKTLRTLRSKANINKHKLLRGEDKRRTITNMIAYLKKHKNNRINVLEQ